MGLAFKLRRIDALRTMLALALATMMMMTTMTTTMMMMM